MGNDALIGKTALVTGAAGGIGKAIASGFAELGGHVLLVDIDEAGEAVAQSLPHCLFCKADLTSPDQCRGAVDRAIAEWGRLDILVNDAGIQHMSPIEEFPVEKWNAMLALMLTAPFVLTSRAIPSMYEAGWGRIINVASAAGVIAHPFKSAYCAAKHGLIGLTKSVALEAGEKGVTANAICPAYVYTPLVERQIADQARLNGISPDEVIRNCMLEPAAIKTMIPVEEVADYAVFLCSESASHITGAVQLIDGGWTAH